MQLFLLYPWAFSKFAFNHRILAMIFLTGNFLNAVDRDGLHGNLLDPMLLCASDKTRLGLSCSECLERYSHLIIPLVMWFPWLCGSRNSWLDTDLQSITRFYCNLRTSRVMCVCVTWYQKCMSEKDKCIKYLADAKNDKARGRLVS